jgi:HD superfamily phosphohydrolase
VFTKNDVFREVDNLEHERTATLAAALLHDVGHGPYSHVFEDVCEAVELKKDHEAYTLELLDTPQIKNKLEDAGVYESTKRFFTEEPGYSVFHAIISSQMDCDRLDFLCRDRHHTGIRSAAIDLEWLFDSCIEQVLTDDQAAGVREYSFVFTEKGLAVAEEFVIALLEVLREHRDAVELRNLGLVRFFRNGGALTDYEALDDSSILAAAHVTAEQRWGLATELAERFLKRDPYKCLELPSTASGNIGRNRLEKFRAALAAEKIYSLEDIFSLRSYKQHDVTDANFLKNILIKKEGEHESLGSVSLLLKEPAARVARIYFRTDEDRNRAQSLFRALQ